MKRQTREVAALFAACGLLAIACGNNEAFAQAPKAPDSAGTTTDEALKKRLERQEAATKLFDKSKPEPEKKAAPAPAKAVPAKAAPEPVKPAPELAKPAPEPAKPAIEIAKPAPEPVKPAPEVAKAAVPVAPAVTAATAPTPVPAPASPSAIAKLVSRVEPDFPREAVQAGAEHGSVKARLTLEANGNVMRVDVVEANPRKVFDRAVVRALSQWRFNEGLAGRTVETEVEFRLR